MLITHIITYPNLKYSTCMVYDHECIKSYKESNNQLVQPLRDITQEITSFTYKCSGQFHKFKKVLKNLYVAKTSAAHLLAKVHREISRDTKR